MIFSPARLDLIKNAFVMRASKFFQVQAHMMTNQDFIDAYIRPEHVAILNTTREICGDVGGHAFGVGINHRADFLGVRHAPVAMSFVGAPPIIIPLYVSRASHDDEHPVVVKLAEWLRERIRQGLLLGDALDSFAFLNNTCADARAFRVVFPAISLLVNDCARSDDPKDPMRKLAARIQGNQEVRTLPRLPREVMQRLIAASDIINTTSLMEADAEMPRVAGHVTCFVQPNTMRTESRPSLCVDGMHTVAIL